MAMFSYSFCVLLLVAIATATADGNKAPELIPILKTDDTVYLLAPTSAKTREAEKICSDNNARLISLQSQEKSEALSKALEAYTAGTIWTSGISFSNATMSNFLLWTGTMEQVEFINFDESPETNVRVIRSSGTYSLEISTTSPSPAADDNALALPNSTSSSIPPNDCCTCPPTPSRTPIPFTRAPCRKPNCTVTRTKCRHIGKRRCHLNSDPICTAKPRKCEVTCEPCRVIKQPVCTVLNDTAHLRCRMKNPEPCKVTPLCRVRPGKCWEGNVTNCTTVREASCEVVIRPCKKPCSERECKSVYNCPDGGTTCAPITKCTDPLVDCSPEVCKSNVQICQPPEIVCHPPKIICDPDEVECADPVIECPEPEATCDEPKIHCDKPVVDCPDAVIHCDPIVAHCSPGDMTCTTSPSDCPDPVMQCDEPTVCDPDPEHEIQPISVCNCQKDCLQSKGGKSKKGLKRKRSVETAIEGEGKSKNILCIAMKKDLQFKWVTLDCNVKHRFVCEKDLTAEVRDKNYVLDLLMK